MVFLPYSTHYFPAISLDYVCSRVTTMTESDLLLVKFRKKKMFFFSYVLLRKFQAPDFEIVEQENNNISKNDPIFYSPRWEPVLYSINNKE